MESSLHNLIVTADMTDSAQTILIKGLSFESLTDPQRRHADKIMEMANELKHKILEFKKELEA